MGSSFEDDLAFTEARKNAKHSCDGEAIHLLGKIQGGVGHVVFVKDWLTNAEIVAVDANINSLPLMKGAAAGKALPEIMSVDHMKTLRKHIHGMIENRSKRTFLFLRYQEAEDEAPHTIAVSLSTTTPDFSIICLELEDAGDTESEQTVYFDSLMYLGEIMGFEAETAVTKAAVETLMNVLGGYDRGMVYRFNGDDTGEVIHEINTNECLKSSYLGLRFPATDIPLPARRMFVLNGHRYIFDTELEDVELLTSEGTSSVDMTQCRMRSVSKYHVMYLRNMGVRASMSLPIIVEGELWGIMAFHGYSGHYRPTLHQRIACETLSTVASVRVEALVRKHRNERSLQLSDMFMKWNADDSLIPNIYRLGRGFLQALDADVISVMIGGLDTDSSGDTVSVGETSLEPGTNVWTAFETCPSGQVLTVSTRSECKKLGLSKFDCPANGFAYFREGKMQVMLGRAASSKDVNWAGDPDKAKLIVDGNLHPRNSFESFMKKAQEEARVWTKTDLSVLNTFSDRLCRIAHEQMLKSMSEFVEDSNAKYMNAVEKARDNYEFFAHLSHELRTPFHGVMGSLHLLNDSINDLSKEEMRDLITGALASGDHMVTLLNDILSLSKNKYLAHRVNQDIVIYQSMVFGAVESFRPLAAKRGLKLNSSVMPTDDKAWIVTDRTKFTQVVANFISNAMKFARPSTAVDVSFSLVGDHESAGILYRKKSSEYAASVFCTQIGTMHRGSDNILEELSKSSKANDKRKWICFSVDDRGCGMESSDLERMFEPYTQASEGSNRSFAGTGLGLFICVSLCVRLGGFISCSSTSGSGTSFFAAIPVQKASPPLATEADDTEETASLTATSCPIHIGSSLLIVDDSPMNLKLLCRQLGNALKRAGVDKVEILQATGGQEAVDIFKVKKPLLVIIDYHMPEMDGSLATSMMREIEKSDNRANSTYIIAYTADGTDKAAKLLFDRGADELLEKPPPKDFASKLISRFIFV